MQGTKNGNKRMTVIFTNGNGIRLFTPIFNQTIKIL